MGANVRKEAEPLFPRCIRPLMLLWRVGGIIRNCDRRRPNGQACPKRRQSRSPPRCIRPLMLLGGSGELCAIEIGGGQMDANVRKGVRAALPPLHSADNVAREGRGNYLWLK